jgi:hypothetical protein
VSAKKLAAALAAALAAFAGATAFTACLRITDQHVAMSG